MDKWDYSGYVTKYDVKCSDGRTIRRKAFSDCDGVKVPMVWQHQHNSPDNVLGHVLLEDRDDGMYGYGIFNSSESANNAKIAVEHGDVNSMSIYANGLEQIRGDVVHGVIREVSLVLAGANPEAVIDTLCIAHSDGGYTELEDEANIYFNDLIEVGDSFSHADSEKDEEESESGSGKTISEVVETMNQDQKDALYFLVGEALKGQNESDDVKHSDEGDDETMKNNLFDGSAMRDDNRPHLTHDQMATIIADGKRYGSLKESFLQHADEYGIKEIDILFPDAKSLNTTPQFIERDRGWVPKVLNGARHTPFSRLKSVFADITEDDARARGYVKGNLKKEEVFSLLKRTTGPQTIYKKQKLDRDDIIDITDFDVVAWLRMEMRFMLDEELARAALVSDGRLASSDDKIKEDCIRPIYNDADLYTIKVTVSGTSDDELAKNFIRTAIKSRKDYKGSGSPTLFTTEDMLTNMLLLEDQIGHALYADETALARKLRVKEIVTVPVMENQRGANGGNLLGVIVNMTDYTFGADRGGQVAMFNDFDIDYNQEKYLIETRCSGALTRPYSAIAIETATAAG